MNFRVWNKCGNFLKNGKSTLSYELALTLDFNDDSTRSTLREGGSSPLGKEIQLYVWAVWNVGQHTETD